ncbi:MAG: Acetyltransferase, GNAT family [uncultured Thermomicrobiales bacterium]|uniref:Acetyltransferase, GNAT family n=1 Tax=uncultured Thermomicrobiales bacterium TaxID=1645740 RepID=A0A6J4V634_9BACT|nr:MAG: Acetyltransferase, GNAT family [uncultured Thermomicrobiales bacterium]
MHIYLETDCLILRRFTAADLDHLVELDADPEVMRFLTGGTPTPRDVIARDILPAFLAYYARGDRYGFWAAIEKATGAFLGWFHLRPLPGAPDDEPELGYRLRRAAWGRGYGTEGSRALIRKGFTELGVRRVIASTYEHNRASRRVMEKSGLAFVRAYRLVPADLAAQDAHHDPAREIWDGDDVEYALDKADWERQEAAAAQ